MLLLIDLHARNVLASLSSRTAQMRTATDSFRPSLAHSNLPPKRTSAIMKKEPGFPLPTQPEPCIIWTNIPWFGLA